MHLRGCEGCSSKAFAYLRCQLTLSSWGHVELMPRKALRARGRVGRVEGGAGLGGGAVFTLFPSCLIYFHTLMFSSSRRLRGKPHRIKPESTPDCLKPLMQPSAIFFVLSVSPPFSREKLKALPARLA